MIFYVVKCYSFLVLSIGIFENDNSNISWYWSILWLYNVINVTGLNNDLISVVRIDIFKNLKGNDSKFKVIISLLFTSYLKFSPKSTCNICVLMWETFSKLYWFGIITCHKQYCSFSSYIYQPQQKYFTFQASWKKVLCEITKTENQNFLRYSFCKFLQIPISIIDIRCYEFPQMFDIFITTIATQNWNSRFSHNIQIP